MRTKMAGLLGETTAVLHGFLSQVLPTICGEDWWHGCVLKSLSHQQLRQVEQRGIDKLSGLDLVAFIRVLDQNWYDINWKFNFPPDSRHYVKELQSVRNRWAHAGVEDVPSEDVYRDLDTLQRFLNAIGAEDALLEEVNRAKQELLGARADDSLADAKDIAEEQPDAELESSEGSFAVTEIVRLKSDPAKQGPVLGVQTTGAERRYQVFVDGAQRWFYESQLESCAPQAEEPQLVALDHFHAQLTALQIRNPGLSTLYSLNAARVDFIPYQFRPVLKFIKADRPRLLIADGVGVGKTIEAGLILRELQARRDVRSVLIICPRPLVTEKKWLTEMKRFEERFTQLDGKALRFCISEMDLEGEWPDQHAKTILPYSLLNEALLYGLDEGNARRRRSKQQGLLDLDPPPRFDLVIVDEAHHVRNPSTFANDAVRFLCDNAEAVVFLTATPIQLGSDDLFELLNILRPDLVLDKQSFHHMAAPNPHINLAVNAARGGASNWQHDAESALSEAVSTEWGSRFLANDPELADIRQALVTRSITPEERIRTIHRLEGFHTFSGIINRTRRRDIGDFTLREPQTVNVEFTAEQRGLHDAVLDAQAEILGRLHPSYSIKFMMTTIRRQAASCLPGLAPLLCDILSRRIGELTENEADDDYGAVDEDDVNSIGAQIRDVLAKAEVIDWNTDPKLDALRKIIADKQGLANNKLMVFSSFRHTLRYLEKKLSADGVRLGLVHGGTPDEERVRARERFKLDRHEPSALDVLLFSEVGCEGLDYQFCDCIVNYDLPWNPMRVEQRIGRIDRNGQKSEKVLIYNIITPGTVDADIYERCLWRIGVFQSAIGAGEEILGDIAEKIRSVAEDIQLSDENRREKLQQIADNEIRLVHEQQQLEEQQAELFGIRLPMEQMQKDIEGASSFWLAPAGLQNLVTAYLNNVVGREHEHILGEKPVKTLRLSQEARSLLLKDFQELPRAASPVRKHWDNWLKGGDPRLAITFDMQAASEGPGVAFITPLHPLARQAAKSLEPGGTKPLCAISVRDSEVSPGRYPFAIYQWRYTGVRDDLLLYPVAESELLSPKLPEFLEHGRSTELTTEEIPPKSVFDGLDTAHYRHWSQARVKHKERTERTVAYRRESLEASHRARIAILEEKLAAATDGKIRRMRQAEITNAQADYSRRIEQLDEAVRRADIDAQPVAYGILVMSKDHNNDQ